MKNIETRIQNDRLLKLDANLYHDLDENSKLTDTHLYISESKSKQNLLKFEYQQDWLSLQIFSQNKFDLNQLCIQNLSELVFAAEVLKLEYINDEAAIHITEWIEHCFENKASSYFLKNIDICHSFNKRNKPKDLSIQTVFYYLEKPLRISVFQRS